MKPKQAGPSVLVVAIIAGVIKLVEGLRSGEIVPKSQAKKGAPVMPPAPAPAET